MEKRGGGSGEKGKKGKKGEQVDGERVRRRKDASRRERGERVEMRVLGDVLLQW